MGSRVSVYLSNKFSGNDYVDICVLDENSTHISTINEFQNEFNQILTTNKSFTKHKTHSNLYFYSFRSKYLTFVLNKAHNYFKHFNHLNLIGNPESYTQIENHLNTVAARNSLSASNNTYNSENNDNNSSFTAKENTYSINHIDEHSLLQDGLSSVSNLLHFSFSVSATDADGVFKITPFELIEEDLVVALCESGFTYYYMPFESASPSESDTNLSTKSKFVGHSPIGAASIVALFRIFVKNFAPFRKEYLQMAEYDFHQIFELAQRGNNAVCDVLVSDIYGDYSQVVKLRPSIIASKFGKIQFPDLSLFLKSVLSENGLSESIMSNNELPQQLAAKLSQFTDKIVGIEHFASSLIWVFVEGVAHHGMLRCKIHNCTRLLLIGDVFKNTRLCDMINEKMDFYFYKIQCLYSDVSSVHPIVASLMHNSPMVRCLYHSHKILNKKYMNTLAPVNYNTNTNLTNSTEQVVKYIESLALSGENRMDIIEDSTYKLYEHANKLYPLQIIRALNAYSHLSFSNNNILKIVLSRNDEMCENSSPQRALELLTLYRSLNLSHELIINELTKSLIKHMHNYSYELYNLGINANYLNINDPIFIESYKTQTLLKLPETSPLNATKNVSSFSRFRVECAELLDSLWNIVDKDNLNIKKSILLMGIFARLDDERIKTTCKSLINTVNQKELTTEEISTILTLKKANNVADVETLKAVTNLIEIRLKDKNYTKTQFIYHLYMLAQLGPDKIKNQLWNLFFEKIFKTLEGFLDPKQMIQLATTLAILKSGNLEKNKNEEIVSQIKASYQKLNLKEQSQLYDSIVTLFEDSKDNVFEHIVRESKPNKLPLMYGNMKDVQLGQTGAKCLLYKQDKNGKLEAHRCVNENHIINVVNREVDVVLSPTTLLDLNVIKKLHKNLKEYSSDVEMTTINDKLKKLLNIK